jgi:hypothetical protein
MAPTVCPLPSAGCTRYAAFEGGKKTTTTTVVGVEQADNKMHSTSSSSKAVSSVAQEVRNPIRDVTECCIGVVWDACGLPLAVILEDGVVKCRISGDEHNDRSRYPKKPKRKTVLLWQQQSISLPTSSSPSLSCCSSRWRLHQTRARWRPWCCCYGGTPTATTSTRACSSARPKVRTRATFFYLATFCPPQSGLGGQERG